ncbi:MAG: hypothetical protein PWP27_2607 [Clostridiales bacterium]|jgi:uncharacterized OsmC-like protein|nr:hypothetical protein [Clostridiales bacterium]MDK2934797.1 hypothetical protein [Clostridiales bacterium]
MPVVKFSVKAQSENPTKTVVETRGFKMTIDEPANLGGTNDGPNPVEYILGALSGCLNVVGHVVAKEMGINMKGIAFELEGELDPARFMGQSKAERAGYKEIRVKIKPDADADQETLEKWLKTIEDRCPVSDNLANPTPIKLSL